MKTCAKCKEPKLESSFYKYHRNNDGLSSYCKQCNKEKSAIYSKTENGKKTLKKNMKKQYDSGYFTYGMGAYFKIKRRMKIKRISFDMTPRSLMDWWLSNPDTCYYCGTSIGDYIKIKDFVISYDGENHEILKFKRFYKNPRFRKNKWMTIDRVDNGVGYELANMVKACYICNVVKSDVFNSRQMRRVSKELIPALVSEIEKENI